MQMSLFEAKERAMRSPSMHKEKREIDGGPLMHSGERRRSRDAGGDGAVMLQITGPGRETCPAPKAAALGEEECLAILHARNYAEIKAALEGGLLTTKEMECLQAAEEIQMPHQIANLIDCAITRATLEWSRIMAWEIWGYVSEPAEQVKHSIRAMTIRLSRHSRSLAPGEAVFRVEPNLRRVAKPIPPQVILLLKEFKYAFRALAYLEPLYSSAQPGQLLRSLNAARRDRSRPVDPLVVGFLGSGPQDYGIRFPAERRGRSSRLNSTPRRSHIGAALFCLGHWD